MAEVAKKNNEKPAKNIVHEQRILVETIKKELREQRINQEFTINPYTRKPVLADKPNVYPETYENIDTSVIDIIKRSNQEPTQKFKFPQTTSQEIGWMTQPLIDNDKNDRRFNYHRLRSEVSAYAEEYFKMFPKQDKSAAAAAGGAPPAKASK